MNNNPRTLNNVLNGINSTLNIVNKAIPIYKEAKPILNTVSSTYKKIKDSGTDIKKVIKLMKLNNEIKKDSNKVLSISKPKEIINNQNYSNTNNPKFFI